MAISLGEVLADIKDRGPFHESDTTEGYGQENRHGGATVPPPTVGGPRPITTSRRLTTRRGTAVPRLDMSAPIGSQAIVISSNGLSTTMVLAGTPSPVAVTRAAGVTS